MKARQAKNYKKFLIKLRHSGISERIFLSKVRMFEQNSRHPSLNFELMQTTKNLNPQIWSFRLNRQWRIMGYKIEGEFQITGITKHYDE